MKKMGMVTVLSLKDNAPKNFDMEIIPVSKDPEWGVISPFNLGPCRTRDGTLFFNMENLWQYSKVYPQHIEHDNNLLAGEIKAEWYAWHMEGARTRKGIRYPFGKGADTPHFSKWGDLRLSYVSARKQIYVPEYAKLLIVNTKFKKLLRDYNRGAHIVIRDYDTYDALKVYSHNGTHNHPFLQALNNPDLKFGHGFVVAMALMLNKNPRWFEQWVI